MHNLTRLKISQNLEISIENAKNDQKNSNVNASMHCFFVSDALDN